MKRIQLKDFHAFLRNLLAVWLIIYGIGLFIGLVRPLGFFVISCFEMAPTYYVELLHTLKNAALWLIPTVFLTLALLLSKRSLLRQ